MPPRGLHCPPGRTEHLPRPADSLSRTTHRLRDPRPGDRRIAARPMIGEARPHHRDRHHRGRRDRHPNRRAHRREIRRRRPRPHIIQPAVTRQPHRRRWVGLTLPFDPRPPRLRGAYLAQPIRHRTAARRAHRGSDLSTPEPSRRRRYAHSAPRATRGNYVRQITVSRVPSNLVRVCATVRRVRQDTSLRGKGCRPRAELVTRLETSDVAPLARGLRHVSGVIRTRYSDVPSARLAGPCVDHIARGKPPSLSIRPRNWASNRTWRARSGRPATAAARSASTVERSVPASAAIASSASRTGIGTRAVHT